MVLVKLGWSPLRRVIILLILIVTLLAVFRLSRIAQEWHYVVPADADALLYAVGFEAGVDDWNQSTRQAQSAEILDSAMRLEVNERQSAVFSSASAFFGDFDVRVQARAVAGPPQDELNNGFGIIFRQQDENTYYMFLISSDGFYRVKRLDNGVSQVLHNWHTSPHINQGLDAVNEIRVVGVGDTFRFYINGAQVEVCIPDDPQGTSTPLAGGECRGGAWEDTLVDDTIASGRLGVIVEVADNQPGGVAVAFDHMLVYGPEAQGE